MFCPNCGQENRENENFCRSCGTQINGASQTERGYLPQKAVDRKVVMIIIFVVIAVAAVIFIKSAMNEDPEIESLKRSVLSRYDYGICIGDALDHWFGGTEEWDSYVDGGITYITAQGTTEYCILHETEKQYFLFQMIDDEHFSFIGAYDMNGNEINSTGNDWYTNGLMDVLGDMFSYLGTSFYETSLKAAFGDEISLEVLQKKKSN